MDYRLSFPLKVIFCLLFIFIQPINESQAGILSTLMKVVKEGGDVAQKAGRKLDDVSDLHHLPDKPGVANVGINTSPDGKLTLTTESGQQWTINSTDDIPAVMSELKKGKFYLMAVRQNRSG